VRFASASRKTSVSASRSVSGSSRGSPFPISCTASLDHHATPTRQSSKLPCLASSQRGYRQDTSNSSTRYITPSPQSESKVVLETYRLGANTLNHTAPKTPIERSPSPKIGHATYGYRIVTLPASTPRIKKRNNSTLRSNTQGTRSQLLYFTPEERQAVEELVYANPINCDHHPNCTDCTDVEFAYQYNKAMPTNMPPEERQRIINNNRSLRNIKNVS
jgi:hypothetical protein